ncbi:hypothetical protein [Pseudomonas sp. R37(2017)]|uniref:hypothetical protein n=1 Tax=Pseudomonas sp. R37(2017) TaxID=1981685 RepID=UPI000A1FC4D7
MIRKNPSGDLPVIAEWCDWTPFAHRSFRHNVSTTIVSGQIAWHDKRLNDSCKVLPLPFMQ